MKTLAQFEEDILEKMAVDPLSASTIIDLLSQAVHGNQAELSKQQLLLENRVRPLVAFDLEATGVDRQKDRIVEIALIKIGLDGKQSEFTKRINPTIPIPKEASDIHGITDEDVKDCPTFADIAPGFFKFIDGCDLLTFNGNSYDVPLLYFEFIRVGLTLDYRSVNLLDAGNIYKINVPRTLSAGSEEYLFKKLEGAHGALADIRATLAIFIAQQHLYTEMPKDVIEVAKYSNHGKVMLDVSGRFKIDDDGDAAYAFGQHINIKVKNELSFLSWMMTKDFAPDTMAICKELWNMYVPAVKP